MFSRADRIRGYRSMGDEVSLCIADWLEKEPTSNPEEDYTEYSCERVPAKFTFGYIEGEEEETLLGALLKQVLNK